ncbi:ras and Rab interactor 2 isoform X1 [Labeo rohita]|uniref:ras and Rab interactor 2 isoform X1 n=1 Tax=Labeo rohita TaxID=84645 RepID=UPI0021E2412A|nr:ras and Rab interactor 2 isoform X1 [Labeo rohita]XP_050967400.1 ras and Rab interactor 2 isoform X1 [Labeo rohita]
MAMDSVLQPSHLDRSGSFLQLVDAFALSLGALEQQMVHATEEKNRDPDISMLVEIEGEMSPVCLQYPAVDGTRVSVSVLDKLIHTHPIWLLLTIDQQEATGILLQQPAGVFLVWKSSVLQKKILSFHMYGTSDSSVIHIPVKESQYTFSLEGSGISFADLFRLVAFYCISRDILPFTLKLPEAIHSAETLSDLHELVQQGAAFWESSLNKQQGTFSAKDSSISLHSGCTNVLHQTCTPTGKLNIALPLPDTCCNTSEGERNCSSSALSFINPVFLKQDVTGNSETVIAKDPTAENGKSRPPPPPRPPPPRILVRSPSEPSTTMPLSAGIAGASQKHNPPPKPPQPPDIDSYRCTIALDDETISRALSQVNRNHTSPLNPTTNTILQQWTGPEEKGRTSSGRSLSASSLDSMDCPPHPIPLRLSQSIGKGLSTDDSSDEYDQEEDDYGVGLERDLHLRLRASRKSKKLLSVELVGARSRSLDVPRVLRGHFHKVRGVFSVLATPEKRILLRIIELSQDKTSYFGCLVQDYVSFVQENKNCHSSGQDLLQTIRQFMTQMKAYLKQSSEMNPPIESYIPEDQIDPVLEKAMHKCVLKPLFGCLQSMLHDFQVAGGVWQRLQENQALAKTKQPHELGVNGARPPDAHAIQRIRRKLRAMCRVYSPERKIMVLLKVCKLIYNIMQDHEVRMFGADDFLPMLTYVLVQCEMPQLDTEILYMMELIDPPLLHGEGGYYLTSAYGAMSLIKNFQEEQAARALSSTTRDTLHQWHQRRTLQRDVPSVDDFQNYMRVALQKKDSGCTAKTLQVQPYATTEEVCRLCAVKFRVSDPENYGLFLYTDDSSQQLAADTHPQWIKAELHSRPNRQHFYFVYKSVLNKNCSTPSS